MSKGGGSAGSKLTGTAWKEAMKHAPQGTWTASLQQLSQQHHTQQHTAYYTTYTATAAQRQQTDRKPWIDFKEVPFTERMSFRTPQWEDQDAYPEQPYDYQQYSATDWSPDALHQAQQQRDTDPSATRGAWGKAMHDADMQQRDHSSRTPSTSSSSSTPSHGAWGKVIRDAEEKRDQAMTDDSSPGISPQAAHQKVQNAGAGEVIFVPPGENQATASGLVYCQAVCLEVRDKEGTLKGNIIIHNDGTNTGATTQALSGKPPSPPIIDQIKTKMQEQKIEGATFDLKAVHEGKGTDPGAISKRSTCKMRESTDAILTEIDQLNIQNSGTSRKLTEQKRQQCPEGEKRSAQTMQQVDLVAPPPPTFRQAMMCAQSMSDIRKAISDSMSSAGYPKHDASFAFDDKGNMTDSFATPASRDADLKKYQQQQQRMAQQQQQATSAVATLEPTSSTMQQHHSAPRGTGPPSMTCYTPDVQAMLDHLSISANDRLEKASPSVQTASTYKPRGQEQVLDRKKADEQAREESSKQKPGGHDDPGKGGMGF